MQKRRPKRSNPWRIIVLFLLVGAALYVNQVIVPATPPLFIPTPTATRAPESFVNEAELLMEEGKFSQAITAYREAIKVDPDNPSNYVTLSKLLVYTANYKEAETNAANALLLNPNNSMAYAVRGWALAFLEDYLGAEAAIRRAFELDPNNAIAYAYLAEVLVYQSQAGIGTIGTLDKAVEASRIAVNLAPSYYETHRARGFVLEQTGNYEEAVEEFEAANAINSDIADIHLALGRNYRILQQYDVAVEEFNRANALNPTDPLPDTYISRTYATIGEFAKAIQFAEQAIKDTPTDPFLYGNLGVMNYRNREYNNAIDTLRISVQGGISEDGETIEGLSLDYGRVAEYYYTFGLALAKMGQCGEALQISQMLMQGVQNDDIAVFNAEEIVAICQEFSQDPDKLKSLYTSTPTPDAASETEVTPTPEPE